MQNLLDRLQLYKLAINSRRKHPSGWKACIHHTLSPNHSYHHHTYIYHCRTVPSILIQHHPVRHHPSVALASGACPSMLCDLLTTHSPYNVPCKMHPTLHNVLTCTFHTISTRRLSGVVFKWSKFKACCSMQCIAALPLVLKGSPSPSLSCACVLVACLIPLDIFIICSV